LYTDGISEAMNSADEEYGEERLYEVVRANRDESAAALVDRVFAAVKDFCADAPQTDDMSMVVIRRKA
ncbi:MAG: SpoIIE family protein phosphatase, partial [Acidobacteriota bacterium]